MGIWCGCGRWWFFAYLVVMVKHRFFLYALGAVLAVGAAGTSAAAGGSKLRITGDLGDFNGNMRDVPLATIGTSINYSLPGGSPVARVEVSDFLFCNHVDTSPAPPIQLAAKHKAWTYGSPTHFNGSEAVVASIPMISDIVYVGQVLWLVSDLPESGGGTQCFTADPHGLGISDLNHIFAGSFDTGATSPSSPNTSAVTISVGPLPQDSDHPFVYYVQVDVNDAAASRSGTQGAQSLPSTSYYLREGFDTSVFSWCDTSPGRAIDHTMTITHTCNVQPGVNLQALDGTFPVVTAALFTGPNATEQDFGDNLAFGYPRESTAQ